MSTRSATLAKMYVETSNWSTAAAYVAKAEATPTFDKQVLSGP